MLSIRYEVESLTKRLHSFLEKIMKTKTCVFGIILIFILGVLGVLTVMCFCGHAPLPQRVTDRARSEITGLLVAITVFQQDHGYYPVATNAGGSVSMRNVLPVITADHKSKEALQLNPRMLNYVDINKSRYNNGEYLDPGSASVLSVNS